MSLRQVESVNTSPCCNATPISAHQTTKLSAPRVALLETGSARGSPHCATLRCAGKLEPVVSMMISITHDVIGRTDGTQFLEPNTEDYYVNISE